MIKLVGLGRFGFDVTLLRIWKTYQGQSLREDKKETAF